MCRLKVGTVRQRLLMNVDGRRDGGRETKDMFIYFLERVRASEVCDCFS